MHLDLAAERLQIVDFVVWLLFRRSASHKPSHLLCHGFQRGAHANRANDEHLDPTSSVPGLVARSPNSHVRTLKEDTWCRLHALLGPGGDRIIMDMLLECAIFCPIVGGTANYYQLSGIPLSDLKPDQKPRDDTAQVEVVNVVKGASAKPCNDSKTLSAITFVRSRMMYAKSSPNAKGGVRFGMRHIR
jgi:telomerase reverse transcriptase